eukprot:1159421-Pelagomonas_calceolata.AAC.4
MYGLLGSLKSSEEAGTKEKERQMSSTLRVWASSRLGECIRSDFTSSFSTNKWIAHELTMQLIINSAVSPLCKTKRQNAKGYANSGLHMRS